MEQDIGAGGASGSAAQAATGNANIDGVLSGLRWNGLTIDFNFPTSAAYYPGTYNGVNNEPAAFTAVSASFQSMVRNALLEFSQVCGLTFNEVGAGDPANMSVARSTPLGGFGGYGYYPGSIARAGDIWFNSDLGRVGDTQIEGRGTWRLVMHEIGHAMGLKHAHETGGPASTAVPAALDYSDFTIMSYRRTPGGPTSEGGNEAFGNPTTLMMLDIAALQVMYGANYNHNSSATTYVWNPATGEMYVNGIGQGAPGANRIYMTVWDGGGVDTYDLSNYTTSLTLNLQPGAASIFSEAQRAILNTSSGFRATGNVFNALLNNGDQRSLIDNANGGSGSDVIVGNDIVNVLNGNAGADAIAGGAGNDGLLGGDGNDIIFGGAGDDAILGQNGDDILWGEDNAGAGPGHDGIDGGAGNDTILGQGGGDTLFGGAGNDAIAGGDGVDLCYGNADADVIFGGAAGDLIVGGAGGDILRGEGGGDLFYYQLGDQGDFIMNFNEDGVRDGFDLRAFFDATGFTGTNPRGAGIMQVLQNGADTDVYLYGTFMFRIQNVTAAAVDDSYFLFQ